METEEMRRDTRGERERGRGREERGKEEAGGRTSNQKWSFVHSPCRKPSVDLSFYFKKQLTLRKRQLCILLVVL